MKAWAIVGFLTLGSIWVHAAPAPAKVGGALPAPRDVQCRSTREFVTTLEFLRAQKTLALPEPEARKTAESVAQGCTGAAGRFIRTFQLLSRAGLGSKETVQHALEMGRRSQDEVETFVLVFQQAFAEDGLDLDLRGALNLALSLTTEFEGDAVAVREDYKRLIQFCATEKNLDLPKPQCGRFAARIARLGQPFDGGIAKSFLRTFDYLRSSQGPGLTTGNALKLSEEIVATGPASPENFVEGYRYAVSKRGLEMSAGDALEFARRMTFQQPPGSSAQSKSEGKK